MSQRTDVLLWTQRILATTSAPPHQLLELKIDATIEQAQDAFHKIARVAHPDLHRTTLSPDELEAVTSAYARAAAAYQEFRTHRTQSTRMRPLDKDAMPTPMSRTQPIPASGGAVVPSTSSSQMSSKALVYYRKAELALRRGDLKSAILQIKMAIAADPASTFLRSALAEVQSEVAKNP